MDNYLKYLTSIDSQQEEMCKLLISWSNINSSSHNLKGLATMCQALEHSYSSLNGTMQVIPLPEQTTIDSKGYPIKKRLGNALRITKRPQAPIKLFLGGHMDTVFAETSPFQKTEYIAPDTLRGPGVADMKGGLLILLKALETFEQTPFAEKIGWEILINPDEEIGSQGSEQLFIEAAKRTQIALLFEPSYSDGAVVSARKGSANFTVVARGRSAHAGRDFHSGRNAITAIAKFIIKAEKLNDPKSQHGITLNIGNVQGGGPDNIVPDLAICRLNVRIVEPEDLSIIIEKLHHIIASINTQEGILLTLHEGSTRMPKPFNTKNQKLFHAFRTCAEALGSTLQERPSGGVCDGNILSNEGLPTLDTLGAIGGNIHTDQEYIQISSLVQRTKLTTYFLLKLANENIEALT